MILNQLEATILAQARSHLNELRAATSLAGKERQYAMDAAFWKMYGLLRLAYIPGSGMSQEISEALLEIGDQGAAMATV